MIVYPNPANDFIKLEVPNEQFSLCSIKIINTDGKIVQIIEDFSPESGSIDISSLAKGWYNLELGGQNGTYRSFFVKE
jgi:hypothetical protein